MTFAANTSSGPPIEAAELATLETLGAHRTIGAGEYLYREGDTAYDFYVVLSGRVDILITTDSQERWIASHGPGRFLGELNLLTGLRVFVSARAAELTEVLVIPAEALRQIIATQPQLSDKILATFLARRGDLMTGAAAATRVIGSRFSPESLRIREFLSRIRVPHEWLDPDVDPRVQDILKSFGIEATELPVVISSGAVLRHPSPEVVAEYLGLSLGKLPDRRFDLVVVGGGPAGLAAAVYGASEGLRTLNVDVTAPGGQAGTSSRIENYFGFPLGVSGAELTQRGLVQAEKFGAQRSAPCGAVSMREEAGQLVVELSGTGSTIAGLEGEETLQAVRISGPDGPAILPCQGSSRSRAGAASVFNQCRSSRPAPVPGLDGRALRGLMVTGSHITCVHLAGFTPERSVAATAR